MYTGITTDVERRLREHQGLEGKNKGAKFFRTRKPVGLRRVEEYEDRSRASKRESEIKKLSAAAKKKLLVTGD